MISDGILFTWETVFSHPSRLEIMKHEKKNGYKIHLTYVTTKHPDINVHRVWSRVLQGGHDVPEDKIRSEISVVPYSIFNAVSIEIILLFRYSEPFSSSNYFALEKF